MGMTMLKNTVSCLNQEQGSFRLEQTVQKENDTMAERDSNQVGGTGGQGYLECSFSRILDDSEKDDDIGDNDDQEAKSLIEYALIRHANWLIVVLEQDIERMAECSQQK